ncbi:YdeI/OmpD-associated family protein [Paenibacillus sp. CAU 1782]
MTERIVNPKVDSFLGRADKWRDEFAELRRIVLDCELAEDFKWGVPCYTVQSKNVVLIHGFKEYCALLFVKGALLKDTHHLLIQQTDNVQAARQIRFTGVQEILDQEDKLKDYILEAADNETSGQKVEMKKPMDFQLPEELQFRFEAEPAFKAAFEALTPGRQRAYLLHFSAAKQAKTREARIDKYQSAIFEGKGLND